MNSAVRSAVRTALAHGHKVYAVNDGFQGLANEAVSPSCPVLSLLYHPEEKPTQYWQMSVGRSLRWSGTLWPGGQARGAHCWGPNGEKLDLLICVIPAVWENTWETVIKLLAQYSIFSDLNNHIFQIQPPLMYCTLYSKQICSWSQKFVTRVRNHTPVFMGCDSKLQWTCKRVEYPSKWFLLSVSYPPSGLSRANTWRRLCKPLPS